MPDTLKNGAHMKLKFSLAIFAILLTTFAGSAQDQSSQQNIFPTFKVEVGIVSIPVVVLDKNGRPLPEADRIKFRVFERKTNERDFQEQKTEVSQPETRPLRGGILIDTSGSAKNQFRYQKDAASEVVKWIVRSITNKNRGDKFFVAEFYYEMLEKNPDKGIFSVKQDWTDEIKPLVAAIARDIKRAAGVSPLFGSIRSAANKFRDSDGRFANFLIVISDGQNNVRLSSLKDAAYGAQAADLPIYTIGTASHTAGIDRITLTDFENNLKDIAKVTGGRFFDLPDHNRWPSIATQILRDLKNRYHLSYKVDPRYQHNDEVKIRVEVGNYDQNGQWKIRPNARLLHRDGYKVIK